MTTRNQVKTRYSRFGKSSNFGDGEIIVLGESTNNKIFETIYGQKTKKLFSTIKEFNRKIIAIDNFLFKKKPNFKNDNLLTFEKNLYNFIDGIKLYFKKLYTILETNNIVSYKEMIQNLNLFYNDLNFYDDIEQKNLKGIFKAEMLKILELFIKGELLDEETKKNKNKLMK